jgi:hypothetical protein
MCVRVKRLYLSYIASRALLVAQLILKASSNKQLLHIKGNYVLKYLKFKDEEGNTSLKVTQK